MTPVEGPALGISTSKPMVSIVFSFRNEAENLSELVACCRKSLEPVTADFELIFVNDASTDGSLDHLKRLRGTEARIKIVNMSRRFGVAPCLWAGLRYSRGAAVVTMDADLQDPPELLPSIIEKWKDGADVVNTVRLSRAGESAFKMWATRAAYWILHKVSDVRLPIEAGDFKLLSRRVVDHLIRLNEKDPFTRGLVTWVGFNQVFLPYHRDKRFSGETHFPLYGTGPVKTFLSGLVSFSDAPLQVSLILGLLVSAGAFLFILVIFVMKFLGTNVSGWYTIMATILFLGGTQLIVLGALGLYLGRVYSEVKNRPPYIVESTLGLDESQTPR